MARNADGGVCKIVIPSVSCHSAIPLRPRVLASYKHAVAPKKKVLKSRLLEATNVNGVKKANLSSGERFCFEANRSEV